MISVNEQANKAMAVIVARIEELFVEATKGRNLADFYLLFHETGGRTLKKETLVDRVSECIVLTFEIVIEPHESDANKLYLRFRHWDHKEDR